MPTWRERVPWIKQEHEESQDEAAFLSGLESVPGPTWGVGTRAPRPEVDQPEALISLS